MWFLFTILCILAWGAGEFFYKAGNKYEDQYSDFRTVIMVGLFFGLYVVFAYLVPSPFRNLLNHLKIAGIINYQWSSFLTYLPVSVCYIVSMWLGYIGLRYLEVSIVGPVSNASGAVTAILLVIFSHEKIELVAWAAIALVTIGIIIIGFATDQEQKKLEVEALSTEEERRYRIGAVAIFFPIGYMIFDSLGTFLDGIVLDTHVLHLGSDTYHWALNEDQAQMSYMLTFFFLGLLLFLYLKIFKHQNFTLKGEKYRGIAGILETIGQVFYVIAMSGVAIIAAPLIASYAVFSVILGHIFFKERLTPWQYFAILLVIIGTIIIGIYDF